MHPLYQGLLLMGHGEQAGLSIASKEENSLAQSSCLLFPVVSLPHGEVTPPKFQAVSSGPFSCCLECQHMPPAVQFSSKPSSRGVARSSRYMADGPGWAVGWGCGVLSRRGHLVRLAGRRDCSGPVGSVCTGWPRGSSS